MKVKEKNKQTLRPDLFKHLLNVNKALMWLHEAEGESKDCVCAKKKKKSKQTEKIWCEICCEISLLLLLHLHRVFPGCLGCAIAGWWYSASIALCWETDVCFFSNSNNSLGANAQRRSSVVLDLRLIGFEAAQSSSCCCRLGDPVTAPDSFKLAFTHDLHCHTNLPVVRSLCRAASTGQGTR